MIALLAPGQGAQSPGMLAPWLELPGAPARIEAWSEAAGLDLRRLGTTASADEIKDTAVTQPLIVALTLLGHHELIRRINPPADLPIGLPAGSIAAGHSVGELAAAAIAGALQPDDAVALAAVRGAEMAAACAKEPTGMSAVIGGNPDEVLSRLTELGLDPANRNGAGQVVAAGPVARLQELAADPPAGAKVVPLSVAGAFHTRYMEPARLALAGRAGRIVISDPRLPLLSNADGTLVGSGTELRRRLVAQVTAPVRWDACMATLRTLGVHTTVEFPPAGTLTGLVKRELRGLKLTTLAIKTPDDIDRAAELFPAELGAAYTGSRA